VDGRFDVDVACIHIADIMARILDLGYGGDRVVPQPCQSVWTLLNIAPHTFENMLPAIVHDYEQAVDIMLA